ncbi:YesL family protein [Halalkalibacter akibai]|uniref:Membrane protein n=1 Tax=Halalkalibacter akibai (strain ATCC 43226 / DSM 21942 / CIP 109018 / JCM 9157 / 1139) TaxID=1236973 RepID=W4QWB0_HALA3|nr:YesL family protein [Halalkalibacter akibai]GAE36197.1 membrane protein [Halalkalibacter akibai JCM 9157]
MNFIGFTEVVNTFCEWLMKLAFLNTLWVIFTLAGAGIFGWAPATAALFGVLRKRMLTNEDFPTLKTFFSLYKKEFFRANLIGLFILIGGWSLYYSLSTLIFLEQTAMILLGTIFFIMTILFVIVSLFIFPVFSHYNIPFKKCFRYSLMLGLSHLHYCLLMVIALSVTAILFHSFPGFLLFYAISIPVACVMVITMRVFTSLEDKVDLKV